MKPRKLSFRPSRQKLQRIKEIESRLAEYHYNPEPDAGSNLLLFGKLLPFGNMLRTPARLNDLRFPVNDFRMH